MNRRDDIDWQKIQAEFGWAVEIVCKHFSKGLGELSSERFLKKRYKQFLTKNDPIYTELFKGMNDEALSQTFVSYWTIAQTMATQSRFWLEDAVTDIILEQVRNRKRESQMVFSAKMLGASYFAQRKAVADLGEDELEHLAGRSPWRVQVNTKVLDEISLIVGEQEREQPPKRKPFEMRVWTSQQNNAAKESDQKTAERIVSAFKDGGSSETPLQCNLLVVDPNKVAGTPCIHGFRFVNPKSLGNHRERRQERANVLRLYGYLVQEKIYDDPRTIRTCVAELLPRYADFEENDHYPDYFSSNTYWTWDRLWKFIGVPYEVVPLAVRAVAKEFRERLIGGLRSLLPNRPSLFDS